MWDVIELPVWLQTVGIDSAFGVMPGYEFAAVDGRDRFGTACSRHTDRLRHFAVLADDGESVLAEPHRHQYRHASHTAAVLHHECIPVAVRSVHHTALRDSVTVEGQVVFDNFTHFESAIQGFGHQAGFCFALALREVTGEDVIASIMLVQVTALITKVSLRIVLCDDPVEPTRHRPA